MVPYDAVLRWPRLYGGRAAKTHTYTHTAANTTSMQTKTDWGPTAGLNVGHTHAEHTLYVQGQHALPPFQTL